MKKCSHYIDVQGEVLKTLRGTKNAQFWSNIRLKGIYNELLVIYA